MVLALLAPGVSTGEDAAASARDIDFGMPAVERYDTRHTGKGAACVWSPSKESVAERARFVLLSGELATNAKDTPPSVPPIESAPGDQDPLARYPARCLGGGPGASYRTWQSLRALQDELAALRPESMPPLEFDVRFRPDVVSYTRLAEPGFQCDWLVRLDPEGPSWTETASLLSSPRSDYRRCKGNCEFRFRYASTSHEVPAYVRARCQPESDYDDHVGYLPHLCGGLGSGNDPTRPFPNEMVADLTDPGYRAFLVAEAKEALSILRPGSAIHIGFKAGQYFCRVPSSGKGVTTPKARNTPEWWIGGAGQAAGQGCSSGGSRPHRFETHQAYCDSGDTPWIGRPLDYGYPQYMRGLSALAADFREAGIPYVFDGDRKPWWEPTFGYGKKHCAGRGCRYFDDEATEADENEMLLEILRGAKRVYMPQATNPYDKASEAAMRADLAAHGVEIVIRDTSKGKEG